MKIWEYNEAIFSIIGLLLIIAGVLTQNEFRMLMGLVSFCLSNLIGINMKLTQLTGVKK